MSHIALYRKYRPQSFVDVRGQESAVDYLESIIKSRRVPHAILLTGSRGIGKTTLARIFAKSLGIDTHDIYEIDAASNNSVDDVRTLIEEVNTLPLSSEYKMYILDEVHMFSKQAFNALLKVLEEPPKHVLFVFATTDLHKVIPTVISRCQVIHLKKPTVKVLTEQIISIAKEEGKDIESKYASMIAERANGSFRDALVLLDQVIEQSTGDTITEIDIDRLGLRVVDHLVFEFIDDLGKGNSGRLMEIVRAVSSSDEKPLLEFLEKLLNVMRLTLYVQHAPSLWADAQSELSGDQVEMIQNWSATKLITTDLLAQFLNVYDSVKKSTIPAIPLELAIIEILSNNTNH